MIININYRKLFVLSLCLVTLLAACEKDPKPTPEPKVDPGVQPTRAELTKDSIYLYAKETYYWNDGVPSYQIFNPRSYDNDQAVLDAIRALPGTDKPFWTTQSDPVPREKYSFLDDGTVAEELGGVSGDYGFSVFYNGGSGSSDLRIKYVSPNSPASLKNLRRGYRILKLNGKTDLNSSVDANISFITNAIFGDEASVSMTVEKPGGLTEDVTVYRAIYSTSPIFHTQIYTRGNKKVAYIVYNSFTSNSNNLKEKFSEFAAAGASELIVDLRYNGGGYVSTAEALSNLIVPARFNGRLMYTTYWTKTMQDGKASILANQPLLDQNGKLRPYTEGVNGVYATYADIGFEPTASAGNVENFVKTGTANFSKVYFLVLSGTASASELLINNLKGVMSADVKLIGSKTYGKPVGFFSLRIDNLDLYIPQFETKNAKDEGGYYDGMTPDYAMRDDVTHDFGDPQEALLAAALNYSEKGTFSLSPSVNKLSSLKGAMSVTEERQLTKELDRNKFKGMIDDKLKLKH